MDIHKFIQRGVLFNPVSRVQQPNQHING